MAQKHLHELLKEDQEPFYITNKRFQLKRLNFSSPKTSLIQIKKTQKPITQTSTSTFCKNTCFFSFNDSPDIRKSPLKSPQNGKVFLHVPTKTATLLEAAMRIQKVQQTSKPKTQIKKVKFGVLGSILKKLKDRNSNKKGENSVRIISTSAEITRNAYEEKCMDLETYSSNNGDLDTCPLSPFRFSLQRCKSTGDVMPEFTSPVSHKKEGKENDETIGIDQLVEEADEKEQCSPVSVLDPPFEEDDDGHEGGDDDDEDCDLEGGDDDEGEGCDLECSYALVQRAQQQLLHKLRRFEKLAELDPVELEKLLLDEEDNDAPADEEEYQVSNMISEEKSEVKNLNYGEAVFGKEVKKFDSSQESRSNTLDMMVKSDLQSEFDEWNNFQEQREETAIEFAFSIFGLLVEEFGEELIH
ncbi:uncharacterized protein LOC132607171 [Lycium barbarum]|uniref:uncharacterized protein LOC132607171 n=1 Tax=Lycium barbarum TaxID=112863 RepID=UPI00293E245F|nr:uncharacterized protein LOC132607171 [Lycium barbarum]